MKIKKILLIILCAVLVFKSAGYACQVKADLSDDTPINAAIRSALIPGWGQAFNEQPAKGWVVLGAFAVTTVSAFYFNEQANRNYKDYKNLGIAGGPLFDDYERNYNLSQAFTIAAIAVYAFGIVDAYLTNRRYSLNRNFVFDMRFDQRTGFLGFRYGRKFNV